VVSSIIHLGLFLILPGYRLTQERLAVARAIPVELVTIISRKTPRKVKTPPPKPKHTPKPKRAKGIYKALISEHVEKLSQRRRTQFALPKVSLPDNLRDQLPETVLPQSSDLFSPEEIFGDIKSMPSAGTQKLVIDDSLPEGDRQSPLNSDTGIEWKGAPRKTLFQPPLPKISSKVAGDVQIKFWVNRNGRVTQMIPVRKLDAELESIALGYIKKWRFEPLPRGKDYLQWGIITLKIRLK
jgi:TonB family protein